MDSARTMKKTLVKLLKITGISVAALLTLMFLLPILFPGKVADKIRGWTNQSINGQLNFSRASLSFFQHFPALTLTLHDFSLTGSAPFEKDTLVAGKALSFGIDLGALFTSTVKVNRFYVDKATIHILVDEKGRANYNIYKSSDSTSTTATDSSSARLKIEGIDIDDTRLIYDDRSLPMVIEAEGFQYVGNGDLSKNEFELASDLHAESLNFSYGGSTYLNRRKIDAELVTGINTNSLSLRFQKNKILVNQLPIDFSGTMVVLKDGYDLDLNLVSGTTDFGNIFSLLPPEYDHWFEQTKFSGKSRLTMSIRGAYKAATHEAPDLKANLWVHGGSIEHLQAPAPLEKVDIVASLLLPKLNADSLRFKADTLQFELKKAPTTAKISIAGLAQPEIDATINSRLDLALLKKAIGLDNADLRGMLALDLNARGHYASGQNPASFRPDTIVTSIPAFQLTAQLKDGYFKHRDLPLALEALSLDAQSDCADGRWQHINIVLKNLAGKLGKGSMEGRAVIKGLQPAAIEAKLDADLNLADLARAIPMKGYACTGELRIHGTGRGSWNPEKKSFPQLDATFVVTNGSVQTPYYPAAITQLQVNATAGSAKGSYNDLSIQLQPVSFQFEGQPFTLQAALADFNTLRYDLTAKGTLDLGKIYQVFAIKDYGVSGKLMADLVAKGTAMDARKGQYGKLQNSGTLRLEAVELKTKEYPDAFFIPKGTLSFQQDRAWLKDLVLQYRNNELHLDGYAKNIIAYLVQGQPLYGEMSLNARRIIIDDFMAFSGSTDSTAAAAGVVLVPGNLSLQFKAAADQVVYGSTTINQASGQMNLDQGHILLSNMAFQLAGAHFQLGASYQPVNWQSANFSFNIKGDSFDVKRAYKEIPLFREMASAAAKAEGIISLNYALSGRLNENMEAVLPSVKGKGELTLAQVKLNGLKLFSAMSKATGKDSLNNPNLKAVVLKTSINNNIVTLERTKMRIFGFRPRIEGQTSLDGKLNLRCRIGLPPLGIIGIPMTITGTADAPKVNLRKGNAKDELPEEADPGQP